MPDVCIKCDRPILAKDGFKCNECKKCFHVTCLSDALKKRATRNKSHWKCDTCDPELCATPTNEDNEANYQSALLNELAAFRAEAKVGWTRIDKIQEDLHSVTTDFAMLKEKIEFTIKETEKTKVEITKVKEENTRLNKVVVQLRAEVNDLQQQSRKNNIIISGIPSTKNENIGVVLDSLACCLNIKFDWYDISAAHRLPVNKKDNNSSSIVVNFVSRNLKSDWMAAKKKKRLTAKDLHQGFPATPIYINEHLTQQMSMVYKKARELVTNKSLAFAWVKDGRMLIKLTATGRTFRIRSLEELESVMCGPATTHGDQSTPTQHATTAAAHPSTNRPPTDALIAAAK